MKNFLKSRFSMWWKLIDLLFLFIPILLSFFVILVIFFLLKIDFFFFLSKLIQFSFLPDRSISFLFQFLTILIFSLGFMVTYLGGFFNIFIVTQILISNLLFSFLFNVIFSSTSPIFKKTFLEWQIILLSVILVLIINFIVVFFVFCIVKVINEIIFGVIMNTVFWFFIKDGLLGLAINFPRWSFTDASGKITNLIPRRLSNFFFRWEVIFVFVLVSILLISLVIYFISSSKWGLQLQAFQSNPVAAATAGINSNPLLKGSYFIGAVLVTFASLVRTLGIEQNISILESSPFILPEYVYINVGIIGAYSSVTWILFSFFLALLKNGEYLGEIFVQPPFIREGIYLIFFLIMFIFILFSRKKEVKNLFWPIILEGKKKLLKFRKWISGN